MLGLLSHVNSSGIFIVHVPSEFILLEGGALRLKILSAFYYNLRAKCFKIRHSLKRCGSTEGASTSYFKD
jgi:hypothetical protein